MFENVINFFWLIVLVAGFIWYVFFKKRSGKDFVYAVFFVVILSASFTLNYIGMSKNGEEQNIAFRILKAFNYALKTFGGDFNSGTFNELAQQSLLYRITVIMCYLSAITLTFLLAIKVFGKNVVNSVKIVINSLRENYIILGTSREMDIFLKSLDKKQSKRVTIILGETNSELKKKYMEMGCAVISGKASRASLKRAGLFNSARSVFLAMSQDDLNNLSVADILVRYICDFVRQGFCCSEKLNLSEDEQKKLATLPFTAKIMYSFIERAEHFAFIENAFGRVSFFNPYEIRAHKFFKDFPITKLIPSAWIDKDRAVLHTKEDGSPYEISNIFVGLGFTNVQLLKKSICNSQLLNCDYRALVIDKAVGTDDDPQHIFRNHSSGLFSLEEGQNFLPSPKEKYHIEFERINALSKKFYDRVVGEIAKRDFTSVLIALGEDKLGIETAMELRQCLYEKQISFEKYRIFVKINKHSILSQQSILNNKNGIDSKLELFGIDSEVLCEKYIVDEDLDFFAKRIANNYGKKGAVQPIVTRWDKLTAHKRESNRYAGMSIQTKLNLMGLDLVKGDRQGQEALDRYEAVYGLKNAQALRQRGDALAYLQVEDGKIVDCARNNLARLEHQRWNTFHLVCGWDKYPIDKIDSYDCDFVSYGRQDVLAKRHACITTFEGLETLRDIQAQKKVERERQRGVDFDYLTAQAQADTINYDFDLMDNLLDTISDSGFVVDILK